MITRGAYCSPFEELAKKSLCCLFIAVALDQDIEDVCALIDSSPQILPLPTNSKENLIHVPFVTRALTTMAQFIGIRLAKLETPLPNCFIGHGDAPLCHQFLNVAKTQRKAEVQPDPVANNLRRKAEAFVVGSSDVRFHTISMPNLLHFSKLTIPDWLVRVLLSLGTDARILAPEELRTRVKLEAQKIAQHHTEL
jgi:hypothetical protein